ncbi:MAG: HAD family hydrolase [Desulfosarcinaceae bacterium]|nr:HAD family hydrolase [Desulfosarcinaceae bacterium]
MIPTIQSVMFDLDGTLIDSVPVYFRSMEIITETVGLPPVPRSLTSEFMTRGLDALGKMVPAEMQDQKEELIEEMVAVGRSIVRKMFREKVDLFPGVERLFTAITERKIPIAVVSSTEWRYMEGKLYPLERKGLRSALAAIIGIEDAPRRKPAPDPLIACSRRLSVSPCHCIYVGDSHVDIQAGRAAGMITVGVLTGLDDRETLKREKPNMIIESVKDLIPFFVK